MNGTHENQRSGSVQSATAPIGTAREIPLTQGKAAIVDEEDYEWLSKYKWQAQRDVYTFYAIRSFRISKDRKYGMVHVKMHREILGLMAGDGTIVDHINRNGLDNRRINMRTVGATLSAYNHNTQKNNTSGYRGVSWHRSTKKWIAYISYNGQRIHLGVYPEIISAALAYDIAAIKYWSDNAILNFPRSV